MTELQSVQITRFIIGMKFKTWMSGQKRSTMRIETRYVTSVKYADGDAFGVKSVSHSSDRSKACEMSKLRAEQIAALYAKTHAAFVESTKQSEVAQ